MEIRRVRLRRNSDTGLIETTESNPRVNPLSEEAKAKEIKKVKAFMKAKYSNG